MFEQTLAIIRNTFFESVRQPIMLVLLLVATLAIVLSNPLSAFTMEDDNRMLVDIGLATVFLCGTLLASLIATSVLTREIDNKTALTIVSKPVGRPLFVIGKFLGVASAMIVGTLYMSFVFLLVEMHGVRQTVRDPVHGPVIVFGVLALLIGTGVGVWCNYFYNRVFASTVICITTPLMALAYLLSLMFQHDFTPIAFGTAFRAELWQAISLMTIAILVLTALAIAASTRLGQVLTLTTTLGVFLAGMLSDWMFGRRLAALRDTWLSRAKDEGLTQTVEVTQQITLVTGEVSEQVARQVDQSTVPLTQMAEGFEMLSYAFWWICYALLPNFQTMLLVDALTQGHKIPGHYVTQAAIYGLVYVVVLIALATMLFQRREVG